LVECASSVKMTDINTDGDLAGFVALTICLSISIIACTTNILILLITRTRLQTWGGKHILYLSLSDFAGSVAWFAMLWKSSNCLAPGAIFLYGYQAAAFWTCSMGFNLWLASTMRKTKPEWIYHLISWGVPLAWVVVLFAGNWWYPIPPNVGCWMLLGFAFINYIAPQLLCFIWNLVFLSMIIYQLKKQSNLWGDNLGERAWHSRNLFFIQLCFLCYTTGIVMQLVSVKNTDTANCLVALQPLLNALASNSGSIQNIFIKKKPQKAVEQQTMTTDEEFTQSSSTLENGET